MGRVMRATTSRANLLMHIVLVPLFLAGNVAARRRRRAAALDAESAVGAASMAVSIALQGRGHRRRAVTTSAVQRMRRMRSPASFSNNGSPFRASSLTGGWLRDWSRCRQVAPP